MIIGEGNQFPILINHGVALRASIPWDIIAPHEAQAMKNHGQTLKELASRFGLSWCEAAAVLQDRPWHEMNETEAKDCVMKIVETSQKEATTL